MFLVAIFTLIGWDNIKNIYVSQEFLTFYYEASEEDMEFYRSFLFYSMDG